MEAVCHIFLKNLVFPWENLGFQCETQIWIEKLSGKTKFFDSYTRKPSFFDRKTWFFDQVPRNNMFMQPTLNQRSTEKPRVPPPSSSYLLYSWLIVTRRPLYDNSTTSMSDTRRRREGLIKKVKG